MSRILILTNNLSGLFSFRIELLERLVAEGYDITVCAPFSEFYVNELKSRKIGFIDTQIDRRGINPVKDFKLFLKYLNIIRSIRPDFVLTYTVKPNIYGGIAARMLNVRQIANITGLGSAINSKGPLALLLRNLYRIALAKATVFFQNESNREFFNKLGIRVRKQILIPGSGVNVEKFPLRPYPAAEPIRFLYVGRIMKEKGIDEFLKLAHHYKEDNKYATEFHILGGCEENYRDTLQRLSDEGIVKWHGFSKDIGSYYETSHCLIHPSYYPEGMSNVILEASSTGRVVITTFQPGCRDAVDDNVTGFLFNAGNFDQLLAKTEAFLALSHDQKIEMGKRASEKMRQHFDRHIVTEAYLSELATGK